MCRDKDVTLTVLYFLIYQYLDPRYQTSKKFALIPHLIYHTISILHGQSGYYELVVAKYKRFPEQGRSKHIFDIVYIETECSSPIYTPSFKDISDGIFGKVRSKTRPEVDGNRCGLNIHGIMLKLYETFEEFKQNTPRLTSMYTLTGMSNFRIS